ncbi:MAG: transglycosylase SLT domain-containing protein [Bdellovibrionales bacterium]|nr:transglycosylase SLT domain-containing protein [Bdellovibrionales bacterium]
MSDEQAALVLAIVRAESGFNPDAAARTSSASGLGQFIDRTGAAYGLTNANRFDLKAGARAVVLHVKDLLGAMRNKTGGGDDFSLLYGLYHDGPSLRSGGVAIGTAVVVPWQERFKLWLEKQR